MESQKIKISFWPHEVKILRQNALKCEVHDLAISLADVQKVKNKK